MKTLSIYTDGGSRGNPGQAALGVVIKEGETVIIEIGKRLGVQTNNFAEYSAIVEGLEWVKGHPDLVGGVTEIHFFMDSLLACQQLKGVFKVKQPHLQILLSRVHALVWELKMHVTYTHIPREKNKEADRMVNLALDNLL